MGSCCSFCNFLCSVLYIIVCPFGHCIFYPPPSTYGFWLPLWYLKTFLTNTSELSSMCSNKLSTCSMVEYKTDTLNNDAIYIYFQVTIWCSNQHILTNCWRCSNFKFSFITSYDLFCSISLFCFGLVLFIEFVCVSYF